MPARINRADGAFDSYINTTAEYLGEGAPITHGDRLGLDAANFAAWQNHRTEWNLIYAKYGDSSKRTKSVTAEKQARKKAFIAFASPLLTAMGVHPELNNDDRAALNLPERDEPTARGLIEEAPYAQLLPMSGGNMKIRVRTTSDGNRASKHPSADHVEMRYALLNATGIGDDGSVVVPPATAAQCPLSTINTKAIFIVALGQENSSKRIYAFFRWVNATNMAHSSPWSTVQQTVVV